MTRHCEALGHNTKLDCNDLPCTKEDHWESCEMPAVIKHEGVWYCEWHYDLFFPETIVLDGSANGDFE